MCMMCDGFSFEEVLAHDAACIEEYGYLITGVAVPGDDEDPASWLYTVGLLDAADHPELIVAGVPPCTSGPVLQALAQSVLGGERYRVGETIAFGSDVGQVGAVHEVQYELSTFNVWHNLQRSGAVRAAELVARQIVLPGDMLAAHRSRQPLLADPEARLAA